MIVRVYRRFWWSNVVRTADTVFIAYPKTGSTWLRYLIGRYLQLLCGSDDLQLFDGGDVLGRCDRACQGPSMHFTHLPLTWQDQRASDLGRSNVVDRFGGKRIGLIVRNPLDAIVSHWAQVRYQIRPDGEWPSELEGFLADGVWGLDKFIAFYNLWAAAHRTGREIALVRYEDLRADTAITARGLLEWLRIEVREDLLLRAVADASFESMRDMEKSGSVTYRSSGMSIFGHTDPSNPEGLHVRRGKVGGYHDYLTPAEAEAWEAIVRRDLDPWYGYSDLGLAAPRPTSSHRATTP